MKVFDKFKVKCINNVGWESNITVDKEYVAIGYSDWSILLEEDDNNYRADLDKSFFVVIEEQEPQELISNEHREDLLYIIDRLLDTVTK